MDKFYANKDLSKENELPQKMQDNKPQVSFQNLHYYGKHDEEEIVYVRPTRPKRCGVCGEQLKNCKCIVYAKIWSNGLKDYTYRQLKPIERGGYTNEYVFAENVNAKMVYKRVGQDMSYVKADPNYYFY
jgi:hypothetical protein